MQSESNSGTSNKKERKIDYLALLNRMRKFQATDIIIIITFFFFFFFFFLSPVLALRFYHSRSFFYGRPDLILIGR
jgi:hypothetical protein